ncbi:hypothetical protein [Pontibacter mangrovi]|uniref:hypothetical protein n=1 Tax=Pontibacter mangrovi TaxID=2589816 RepID=UPI0015E41370|nr:hypothetical protein [Pontibacter mangrovi]
MLVFLIIVSLFLLFVSKKLLLDDGLYYEAFSDQLSISQISSLIERQNNYEILTYTLVAVTILVKCSVIALILYTGTICMGVNIEFNKLFKIAIISDFIFLIPNILKIGWFCCIQNNYTLSDLQFFYPLSALNIFETNSISQIWIYPLQLLNVFEVAYWFLLAFGIHRLIKSNFDKSLKLVLSSYIPAMLLWVVFIMFLTVTFNPA